MARILAEGRWHDELRSVAYYSESELEKWILQHASLLFPHHFVFPFKMNVAGQTAPDRKRPDLALIRRDFSAWTVVEVELEKHTLSHVLDQTRVFVEGKYNALLIAEYARQQLRKICRKRASLDRLTNLFSAHAPSVLVIADEHAADWQEELGRTGVDFCVFEVYKNVIGRYVYRILGQYPSLPDEKAHCRAHKSMPNVVEVIGPFTFKNLQQGKSVEVIYDEYLTRWEYFEDGGKQYLRFVGTANPLSPNDTYALFRDKSQKYSFKRT